MSDFLVSRDISFFLSIFFKIFFILFHSTFELTGFDPGLVDSPPISTMCAPLSKRWSKCFFAVASLLYFPPSEKLSGVMFKTPLIFDVDLKLKLLIFFFFFND